jgi:hypothetical protein
MEPLRGGALADGLPQEAIREFRQVSPQRSAVEWAFRWLWRQPEISTVLSGMTTMDQLVENLKLADTVPGQNWTEADRLAIDRVNKILKDRQRVACTSCGYCMPCPQGVDIPRNFMLCNDHYMLNDRGASIRYFRLLQASQRASACIQCGECLDKCPQQILIPDELEHVVELFEP